MSWVPFAVAFVASAGYFALHSIMFEEERKASREIERFRRQISEEN